MPTLIALAAICLCALLLIAYYALILRRRIGLLDADPYRAGVDDLERYIGELEKRITTAEAEIRRIATQRDEAWDACEEQQALYVDTVQHHEYLDEFWARVQAVQTAYKLGVEQRAAPPCVADDDDDELDGISIDDWLNNETH